MTTTTETTDIDSLRLVRDTEAARLLSVGRSTWWAWVRDGRAPQPVKVNDLTRWRLTEVLALQASRPTTPSTPAAA